MERQRSLRRRIRSEKPFAKKFKECVRKFIAFMFSNVGIIGLVVGYAIAGALIFQKIEGDVDVIAQREKNFSALYANVSRYRNETAHRFWNLTLAMNTFNEKMWRKNISLELERYQMTTVRAIRNGFSGIEDFNQTKQWTISGAFLYSLTVITTIGYGNIVPKTPWGKVATIIYAIIGMPLFLLYLSNIGDIMARSFKWIYATCCLCKGCPGVSKRRAERRRQRQEQLDMEMQSCGSDNSEDSLEGNGRSSSGGYDPDVEGDCNGSEATTEALTDESFDTQTVTVPVTICLTIMVGYILAGAWLFAYYEDWNMLDGSYFCFISLSTIGFGDIVPGDKIYSSKGSDVELSFIFCSMYLMLGMALIAMCFNLMQEEVIHKFRTTMATIKYVLRCDR